MQRNLESLLRTHVPPDLNNPKGKPAFSRQTALQLIVQFSQVSK
tara:strand:+ start:369 stop:500 length:132 start_codon:yes stop_codon:yes gene_type:complete